MSIGYCKESGAIYDKRLKIIESRRKDLPVNIPFTSEQCCSICLETYEESTRHDAVRLVCQHAFGRKCIQAWASQSNKCPTCRSNFSSELLRSDENTPLILSERSVVTLREKKFAVYSGIIVGLFACSCVTIPVISLGAGAIHGVIILFSIGLLAGIYSICENSYPLNRYFFATLAICFLSSGLALLAINTLTDIS